MPPPPPPLPNKSALPLAACAAAACDADIEESDEVAVDAVTVVGCPNFVRSVLVLLAAVTSDASLPTRIVRGSSMDKCNTPDTERSEVAKRESKRKREEMLK